MNRYIYMIGAWVAVAFTSCQKEENGTDFSSDPNAVRISASVGENIGITRSNPTGDAAAQKVFNTNDAISVKADGQTAVVYTLTGGSWTPQAGQYLKWETPTMNFTAYYPVGANNASATAFDVPTDQSSLEKIAKADYMTFGKQVAKDKSVDIMLQRKTARVVVHIAGFNDQYATGYSVTGVKVNGNTNGYAGGIPKGGNVTVASCPSDSSFYALLTPTHSDNNATFLTLTVTKTEGGATTELTVKGIPALLSALSYTYNITVGKNAIIVGSVTVKGWGDETVIPEGETVIPIKADATTHTVTTKVAGALAAKLATNASYLDAIVNSTAGDGQGTLKLIGTMNEDDIWAVRDWALTHLGEGDAHALRHLDMSGVTGMTKLPDSAFEGITTLASISLPATMTEIGTYAFFGCTNLKEPDLSNVTTIGDSGFSGCSSIGKIIAPKLAILENRVFYGCGTLSEINLEGVTGVDTGPNSVASLGSITVDELSLPLCTSLCKNMFINSSISTLRLTAAGAFTINQYAFSQTFQSQPILVLNVDKKPGGSGSPLVTEDNKWGYKYGYGDLYQWATIKYVDNNGNPVE